MSGSPRVSEAFHRMAMDLELKPEQRGKATGQEKELRRVLGDGLALDGGCPTFLTGSFARGTAIQPLKDIDLFAVLDPNRYGSLRHRAPVEALGLVHGALRKAYRLSREPVPQDHTVRIDFNSTSTRFEVVPALRRPGGGYYIPQKATEKWIASDPDRHLEVTRDANRRTNGMAATLVKMVKHFKGQKSEAKIASFHLEMMVCELVRLQPADYAPGLRDLLAALAGRVMRPFADPAGIGPDIDERLSPADRTRLAAVFRAAAEEAGQAITLEGSDREGAHWLWRKLLGDRYPFAGRKALVGGQARVVPGIDPEGSRFG